MFKLRLDKEDREFSDRDSLFNWIRDNYGDESVGLKPTKKGVAFAILEFNRGNLLSMDRFRFNGTRFVEAESTTR